MTLKEHIKDIRNRLEKEEFPNEAAVCDDIVRRLVHELGWPRYQPQIVYPQYPVEGGKVDFALCHPPSEPCVFIEVKQVGNIEGAEEQLFRYAFRRGVPIAILTDGQKWRFFYPIGQGDYRERKVHELDLIEGDIEESVRHINRYLNYESIQSGKAIKAIEEDYRNVSRQRQVATRLPEAWNKLVAEADEFLLHAVAEKTESLCGYRPTDEQVLSFLKSLKRETELDRKVPPSPLVQQDPARDVSTREQTTWKVSRQRRAKATSPRFIVTMPNGKAIERSTKLDTFVEVLLTLIEMLGEEKVIGADEEGSCISTAPLRPGVQGRQYGNYFISTNHGTEAKKRLLDKVALNLGINLKVDIF